MSGFLFAQDPLGSETVTVVKTYTPSVADAKKINQDPSQADSLNLEKKAVEYSIFSVPVASTFTPAKGRARTVQKSKALKVYDNYATLGFGNYSNVLAEFYSNLEISRSDNFGIFLKHNSSQGGIDGVVLDDKYYDTALNLSYNSRDRDMGWETELGVEHQLFNWYGINPSIVPLVEETEEIDPQQNYFSIYAGGELELYDSFFNKAKARIRHTGDSFSTSENHFNANGLFEISIAEELITTNITADIVNGTFDKAYPTGEAPDYTYLNFGVSPSLLILRDDLSINLGLAFYYSLDAENSDNNIYLYPKVTASYRLAGDYFTAYAGIEGDLEQNTYYKYVQKNPYVSPTLNVTPTDNEYDAYVGAKGKLNNSVSYNVRGSYASSFNKPFFMKNLYAAALGDEGYLHGNSFDVVYDDLKTLSFYGELNVEVNRDFRLGINAEFFSYDTTTEMHAWNLPDLKASLNADYQISDKWFMSSNLFYVGERKDVEGILQTLPEDTFNRSIVTLDSYFDVNAKIGYKFNDQLSVFAKGNNLLNNDYDRWSNFSVQGLQLMAGATYKFDFN